jgi:hypothetical protein
MPAVWQCERGLTGIVLIKGMGKNPTIRFLFYSVVPIESKF